MTLYDHASTVQGCFDEPEPPQTVEGPLSTWRLVAVVRTGRNTHEGDAEVILYWQKAVEVAP